MAPHPRSIVKALVLTGWMVVIFFASADTSSGEHSGELFRWLLGWLPLRLTPEQEPVAHYLLRKAAHFTEYAILGLLWAWNLRGRYRLGWSWGLSTLYAALDELHQAFVPARAALPTDVALDSAGALTALLLQAALARLTKKR